MKRRNFLIGIMGFMSVLGFHHGQRVEKKVKAEFYNPPQGQQGEILFSDGQNVFVGGTGQVMVSGGSGAPPKWVNLK